MGGTFFETKDLAVGYDGKALIHDICLSVRRGEIVTLIGPNGSGKSTILKSITRHLRTISGSVLVEDALLQDIPRQEFARKLAVMLTDRMKPELMTCRDVVATGRYPYTGRLGFLTQEDERKVQSAMERVNAAELAERDFNAISDGQRQRVLLARAICQEPEILVLDEPTSYLDIRHKLELLSLLREMAKERGIAVILSLHEIDLAQKLSDRIVCVKGSTISCFGTPAEVFTEDRISSLYELESGAYDPLFGSVELPAPQGAPQILVISNCGSGIPVYRALQKEGIPFAAAILPENDVDYRLARVLAAEVISCPPFAPISDDLLERAMRLVDRCDEVRNAGVRLGAENAALQRLIDYAKERGKL